MADSPYASRPWLAHHDPWVPPHLNYPSRPLYDILATAASRVPERPATAFLGATLTYGELKQRTDRLAAGLCRLGVRKGDRVAIMLPTCPQSIISAFAILRLGAVVVSINPSYTAREVRTIAADAGVRALITLDTLAELARGLRPAVALEHVIVTTLAEYAGGDGATAPAGTRALTDLIKHAGTSDLPVVPFDPDDLAVLQYTSGSSGVPKGVMLTHANIFANVFQTEAFMYGSPPADERYLIVIPYFHIYAFTVGMMRGTWIGALQILLPRFEAGTMLAAIRDFTPTYVPAVPAVYVSLLSHPRVRDSGLARVRMFNTGGAPCPVDLMAEWERVTTRPLNQGYGLSETSPVTHSTPQRARRRPGTVGLPLPGTDVRIVDVETGTRELPLGDAGELCIAGPQVMKGYWNRPEETSRVLRRDGEGRTWFHTGDVARMDADGFTTIVRRKTDLIIVNGFNVYPAEVEAVLCAHPAVRLAVVTGVPDADHGEVVRALIALNEGRSATREEILAHCRQSLAP